MGTYTPPPPESAPQPPRSAVLREAYLANSRVRMGSDIARMSAAALILGLLGTLITWGHRSALFDLANSSTHTVKPGVGYLVGPVIILAVLPLVSGRTRPVAIKRSYRKRLTIALLLWATGLAILIGGLASIGGDTIQAGAYIAGGLLIVGLVATLAMWPADLPVIEVDSSGMVPEQTGAAGVPEDGPPTSEVSGSGSQVSDVTGNGSQVNGEPAAGGSVGTEPARADVAAYGRTTSTGRVASMTNKRTVRDFVVSGDVDVVKIADAWAQQHGYAVAGKSPDGHHLVYRKGEGLMTGFRMLDLSVAGEQVHLEAWVGAIGLARAMSLFILPKEIKIESGGMKAVLPRKMGRSEVNDLLESLGQPPIA